MTIVGSKLGVNSFGTSIAKPEGASVTNNLSAQDKARLGEDDVGAVANKIVDPNWTDPSKKVRTTGNPNLDKDAFFKLMLTQMKNQDPTNPMKSHEMAAQLANFSSLEQMQNMNKSLEELKNAQKPTENFQALNLIGKAVSGDSSRIIRGVQDRDHDLRFALPMDAGDVSIKVSDADGNIIRNYEMKSLKKGDNKISWNGENDKGMKLAPGEYKFAVEAKTADGNKIAVRTDFEGMITGVSYSPEGPILNVGKQAIRFRDVQKITDPRLLNNDQKVNDVTNLDLKKDDAKGETTKEGNVVSGNTAANLASAPKPKGLESLGLSRAMMDKIAKETQE